MKSKADFLGRFVNKEVEFRFHGEQLRFCLSQSLFSSYDIDDGSKLLLKTIATEIDIGRIDSALDVGCGIGVLALSLKKVNPEMVVVLQDRNALALAFSELNAQRNGIEDVDIQGTLALAHNGQKRFDLIVSNLPGKAGRPVLQDIVKRMSRFLTPRGRVAIVIVKPLADLVKQTLIECGAEILLQVDSKSHVVFHFRGEGIAEEGRETLEPYIRGKHLFRAGKAFYTLRTAYNIPEFDTLGHQTALTFNVLRKARIKGKVLFWNVGQGHIPVLLSMDENEIREYVLAGRDLLSILISKSNLMARRVPEEVICASHLPYLIAIEDTFDAIIAFPDFDPGVSWEKILLDNCFEKLNLGGALVLTAKSAFMHRLLNAKRGFKTRTSKKRHGFRSVWLEK